MIKFITASFLAVHDLTFYRFMKSLEGWVFQKTWLLPVHLTQPNIWHTEAICLFVLFLPSFSAYLSIRLWTITYTKQSYPHRLTISCTVSRELWPPSRMYHRLDKGSPESWESCSACDRSWSAWNSPVQSLLSQYSHVCPACFQLSLRFKIGETIKKEWGTCVAIVNS